MANIGSRSLRLDARDKVTGAAKYGGDLPGKDALTVTVVRSAHPHAEILSIDTSRAEATSGVVAVFTHRDMPGTNMHGLIRRDQEVLASRFVRHLGDAVALVVAEDPAAAERAKALVAVTYRPLPVVATVDDALAPGAPVLHPDFPGNVMGVQRIRKGDAERAMAAAEVVVEETFQTQTVDHAFLDLEAGMACMDGDVVTIHASGQWVHEERRLVALALGLPLERVRIVQPHTGGAFGGREDISIQVYLGLAALKLGRPVQIAYSRHESTVARHKRHAIRIRYRLGAKRDGTLVAAQVEVLADEGAYASTGPAVIRKASSHATGPYRIPDVSVDVTGVFTNNSPTGAMRGFGACQLAIAYEGAMDRLAARLGMDRVELKRRNLIGPGEGVTTGQVIPVVSARQCLDVALERAGWATRSYDTDRPYLKRGYGVSTICFGLGYGDGFPDASRARVCFEADDGLVVYTGAVEVGQGLWTMVAQVAGEVLGVPASEVRVVASDTMLTPEAGSSSATRQTFFTGNAVYLAAHELKRQLLDIAGGCLGLHPDELSLEDQQVVHRPEHPGSPALPPAPAARRRMPLAELLAEGRKRGYDLCGQGLFQPGTIQGDAGGQSPRAFVTYLFGAQVAQVLVDAETGVVTVERMVAVHDVGKALNPTSVEGQIEGGVVQGLGMALMEEIVRQDGKIMNGSFTDYILPGLVDVPPIEAVYLEVTDPAGPFGARGIGEPPLIGAVPAIFSAIADAIGRFVHEAPATPERVWRLLNFDDPRAPLTSDLLSAHAR